MRPGDVAAVARLEQAIFRREAWPRAAFAYLHEVLSASRPPRGRLWVATDAAGHIVGYVGIELSALGGEADVINLAVDPAARRRGIGRRLLGTAVSYCRSRRVPLVWLRVRAGNGAARAFYRRCGFAAVGRFRAYYDEPPEDAVLMAVSPSGPARGHSGHPGAPGRRRSTTGRSSRSRRGLKGRRPSNGPRVRGGASGGSSATLPRT
jgi:ribosomal-protein-alanine N-acetyltransferase